MIQLTAPDPDELLVIVGPTASGKTALSLELARQFGGEIVNADSVQIYRHFDIGSGKPSQDERASVPHHLFDALDPLEAIDAGRYADTAREVIADIRARGRVPIVCGGTFLWVLALTHGLAKLPQGDDVIRARHAEEAERDGRQALHAKLAVVDPKSAARISPNDFVRTSRALEVFELSGKPLSAFHEEHGFVEARERLRLVGIDWAKEDIEARIAARTRSFLERGFIGEVARLIESGYRDARAMGSVGYRQVVDFIEGRLPEAELPEAINRATRVFVRRQRTWLRDRPVLWLRRDA